MGPAVGATIGKAKIAMFRTVFNSGFVTTALRLAQAKIADMKPVYDDIGEYMIKATKDRFKAGIDPDGTPWVPKKPATIERYRRMGDGDRPDPLIGPSRRLSNEIVMFANQAEVEVGSNLEYSAVMQGGAGKGAFGKDKSGRPIPWGYISPRVWLGISDTDERNIIDIVDEHMDEAFS